MDADLPGCTSTDQQDGRAAQSGDSPAVGDPEGPGQAGGADGVRHRGGSAPASPGRQADDAHTGSDSGACGPAAAPAAQHDVGYEGEGQHHEGDELAAPGSDHNGTLAAADSARDGGQSVGLALAPALVAEITRRIEQINVTASAAATVLTGGENPRGALASRAAQGLPGDEGGSHR